MLKNTLLATLSLSFIILHSSVVFAHEGHDHSEHNVTQIASDDIHASHSTEEHQEYLTSVEETKESPLKIQFRQTLVLSDSWSEEEKDRVIKTYTTFVEEPYINWRYNEEEGVLERFVSFPDLRVEVLENSFFDTTNYAGQVLLKTPRDNSTVTLNITSEERMVNYQKTVDLSQITTLNIDLDLTPMATGELDDTDTTTDSPESRNEDPGDSSSLANPYWYDGQRGIVGKRLHCNRFNGNGFFADNTYYASHTGQALENFKGSDCEISFLTSLNCIGDYTQYLENYCAADAATAGIWLTAQGKEATCSGAIGRQRTFHYN